MGQFSMQTTSTNPLAGYFRHPAIYLKLPSLGRWWPKDAIDLPENLELAIYPMTAKDEIILKTPDALLNGQGMIDVIQSCCPNIKNAWDMPSVDVDAILISIRIASYGNMMSVESACPHCQANNNHEIALDGILSEVKCPDYNRKVEYRDLVIHLKPQPYFQVNRSNMAQFEETKILNALNDSGISDQEKARLVSEGVQKLVDIGVDMCVHATHCIDMPNGQQVDNLEHIRDFYHNAEKELINQFQMAFEELNNETKIRPRHVGCGECTKEYEVSVDFDYSNFFAKGF